MNEAVALRPDLGGENFSVRKGSGLWRLIRPRGDFDRDVSRARIDSGYRSIVAKPQCYLHGNLPVQTSPFAEESESSSEQVTAVSRSSTRDLFVPAPGRTRVNVDRVAGDR